MALLFRALSTNRNRHGGYNRLLDETLNFNDPSASSDPSHAVLKRVTSVPARMLFGSSSKKTGHEQDDEKPKQEQERKKKGGNGKSKSVVHPLYSLIFEGKWGNKKKKKKMMTANPDFSRYMDYLKEGGVWNKDADSPVIYYK